MFTVSFFVFFGIPGEFCGVSQVSFAVHLRRIVAFNMLLSAKTDSELN